MVYYYNSTDTCEKVKEDGKICRRDFHGKAYREIDKDIWTGKWICSQCYLKKRDKKKRHEEYRERYITNRLTGNQDPNHSNTKGDLTEELTNRWKGTDNLNKKNDNYRFKIDHSPDPITGLIYQTKSKRYDPINRCWKHHWEREHNKGFDILVFYCISKDGKTIEMIYEFPKFEVIKRTGTAIYKYVLRGPHWYEKYRVTNEEELKKVNKIWREILEESKYRQHGIT